mgnify:CR=1 FL=1
MLSILPLIFVVGYLAIALEEPLKIHKSATALLLAVLCWIVLIYSNILPTETVIHNLETHLSDISQILFFLIGAMTIVELIDAHKGFKIITDFIQTANNKKLLWFISFITFFLSAVLDNLTTAIVMVSLLRKLIHDKNERILFASMVIIAANAGGAWTPIGDVTTTMLWIGGQISALNIMKMLFLPSLISLLIPLLYQTYFLKGNWETQKNIGTENFPPQHSEPGGQKIFWLGIGSLIFVPIFKTITHLPPYMGVIIGLAILWIVTDLMHHKYEERTALRVFHALTRIDIAGVLFFLGILLAVAALETGGILHQLAEWMQLHIGNNDIIVTVLGLLSAIIDNVPLVAATMGMYDMNVYPMDAKIWEMIAYCAGTGGSILIIGSAAGVVVMGMENISFKWYLKKISFPALLGYLGGVIAYLVIFSLLGK